MKYLEDIHSKRIKKENFLITLLLLFKSSQASVLAFSPITTILFLIIVLVIFKNRKLKVDRLFINFSIIYFITLIVYFASFGWFDFTLSIYIYLKFLYAYLSIKIVGFSFFKNFQKIVYYGALISIPLFIIQLLFFDLLFDIVGIFQNNISFLSYRNNRFANIFFFSIEGYGAKLRNSGFMWEPKGYANILILAIIFNLIQNKFKLLNKRILVYLIALLTTFSTTGYLIFFTVLPLFFVVNKSIGVKMFSLIIIITGIFYISKLDFMFEKIKYESTLFNHHEKLLNQRKSYEGGSISLGRIGSLVVDFNDFIKRPIFGYGYQRSERTQSEYVKLVRVNGFSDILATYGSVGIMFLLYSYNLLFKKLLRLYNLKGAYILLLSIFIIYFASAVTSHVFWMSLLFLHLVIPKKNRFNTK